MVEVKPMLPDPVLVRTVAPTSVTFLKPNELDVVKVPLKVAPEGEVAVSPPV